MRGAKHAGKVLSLPHPELQPQHYSFLYSSVTYSVRVRGRWKRRGRWQRLKKLRKILGVNVWPKLLLLKVAKTC